jgi:hypothetical protein
LGILGSSRRTRLNGIFPGMRGRILILLLCVMAFSATFLVVGCSGGGSQGQEGGREEHGPHREEHATQQQGANVKLTTLRPKHNSAVSGIASFEENSEGVLVTLKLRNLPKPDTFYLAHIHPGPCAQEDGAAHAEHSEAPQHGEHHEEQRAAQGHSAHERSAQIDYPLSQVKSDSDGRGSSTTTLRKTSVDKLGSGEPKHVNVHEAGSGNPPILTCAELTQQEGGGEKEHGSHDQSHDQSHGQQAQHEQHPIEKACREEPKHLRVFNCEPMAMVGVEYDVQMQPERDRQTYEQALAHIDRVVSDELEIYVYFYSGEEDYRENYQNAVATVTVAGEYSVGQYGKSTPPLYGNLERKDK